MPDRGHDTGELAVLGGFGKLVRAVDLDDQLEACRRVFASDTRWTVVCGSELGLGLGL